MFSVATPATFDTPTTVQGTPVSSGYGRDENATLKTQSCRKTKGLDKDDSDLTLDKFLSKNVSEDNASFETIMDASAKKHREKYGWLYDKEVEQRETKEQLLALPSSEEGDQFKDEARPAMIETWNYTNRNTLMYCPDGVELSAQEKIEGKNEKRQEISHKSTRFKSDPFPDSNCTNQLAEVAAVLNVAQQGKVGVDGREQGALETPKVEGFSFVATPSPAPGLYHSVSNVREVIKGKHFKKMLCPIAGTDQCDLVKPP